MSRIVKVPDKPNGVEEWGSLLVQAWKSDKARLDEHYAKTDSNSTMFWDAPLQKHLRVGYKR